MNIRTFSDQKTYTFGDCSPSPLFLLYMKHERPETQPGPQEPGFTMLGFTNLELHQRRESR